MAKNIVISIRFTPEVVAHALDACDKLDIQPSNNGDALRLMALAGINAIKGANWQLQSPSQENLSLVLGSQQCRRKGKSEANLLEAMRQKILGKTDLEPTKPSEASDSSVPWSSIDPTTHISTYSEDSDKAWRVWSTMATGLLEPIDQLETEEPIRSIAADLLANLVWDYLDEDTRTKVNLVLQASEY